MYPESSTSTLSATGRQTKHRMVVDSIRRSIASGELMPGDKMPPRPELEAQFDVTNMTIQRAVDQLKQEGFLYSRGRWGLFVGDHPPCLTRYGLVIPRLSRGDAPDLHVQSICDATQADGLWGDSQFVIYRDVAWPTESQRANDSYRRLLDDLQELRLAGLVFSRAVFDLGKTPLLAADGLPRVALASSPWKDRVAAVRTDQEAFHEQALQLLAERGCRRVALLTPCGHAHSMTEHFMTVVERLGLQTDDAWIQGIPMERPHWARNSLQLLASLPADRRPDGLVISDDNLLPHATAGMLAAGLRVPDELCVVAHANFPCRESNALGITRLGFDSVEVLQACLDLMRSGEVRVQSIGPRLQADVAARTLHDLHAQSAG